MSTASEKELDRALEHEIRNNPEFAAWFLGKTKFAGQRAACVWSRSDHPYGRVRFEEPDRLTGKMETVTRESETDVLVVFETDDKRRFALHIENKRGLGTFTPRQAELYEIRARAWVRDPKYGSYVEWETVLVAPAAFYKRFRAEADKFDRFIAHEEIARYIGLFASSP